MYLAAMRIVYVVASLESVESKKLIVVEVGELRLIKLGTVLSGT